MPLAERELSANNVLEMSGKNAVPRGPHEFHGTTTSSSEAELISWRILTISRFNTHEGTTKCGRDLELPNTANVKILSEVVIWKG